jgi:transposase
MFVSVSLVAARFNPQLRAKWEALRAAGKPPEVALTAMRKLLILATALLRDDRKSAPSLA